MIKWRYFVPKIIDIGLDLLELYEHITGVQNFFETQCSYISNVTEIGREKISVVEC